MDGSGWVWRVCDFMIQTQPNLLKIFFFEPNPTHQTLNTDPTQQVVLGLAGR